VIRLPVAALLAGALTFPGLLASPARATPLSSSPSGSAVQTSPALTTPAAQRARVSPGPVAQPAPVLSGSAVIEAEEIAYDAATETVTASGRVRVTHPRFRLLAGRITYDLRAELLTAEGGVRLIDETGRELRGERLVLDVRRERAIVLDAETIVSQVYLRGARVDASPERIEVQDAMATLCDPRRPPVRVTARRVEVRPGEELVAHQASLWLGSIRVVTLGTYRQSLRPGEQGRNLPSVGYNTVDGFWVAYPHAYRLGQVAGELNTRYTTRAGFFVLNTLRYERPDWSATLRTGRTQIGDVDGVSRRVTLAEAVLALPNRPLTGGLSWSAHLSAGWAAEADSGVSAPRMDALVTLSPRAVRLGPDLAVQTGFSARYTAYGAAGQRAVLGLVAATEASLGPRTSLSLRYDLAAVSGATPFLYDRILPANTVALGLIHHLPPIRASLALSHNFIGPETKLFGEVSAPLGPNFSLGVAAVVNLTTRGLEDLDYTLAYRCDCVAAALRYRPVRREVWVEVNLVPSPAVAFQRTAEP